ncbi:hypothetical protein HAX54_041980 [Datura stramonium]|uniref:Uncharacterized protein n=1 Tax=Datura stramonium TaxID=4076 RepID=A0ABS8W2J2_DATST|nr:hypothetical protein [Datura stramonium]
MVRKKRRLWSIGNDGVVVWRWPSLVGGERLRREKGGVVLFWVVRWCCFWPEMASGDQIKRCGALLKETREEQRGLEGICLCNNEVAVGSWLIGRWWPEMEERGLRHYCLR